MAKQLSGDEQIIKRKARRRFIGAFALTLAVVVILPMVLDSEPRPSGQDIELRIPPADEAGEFVPKISVSSVPAVLQSSELRAMSAMTPPSTPGIAPVGSGSSGEAVSKGQPAASQKANPKSTDKPVAEGFVVQVGAFSNADTAKQEMEKLKNWDFKAYTEKAGGMIRVRVGPYPDREKAEKVRQLLEKHGMQPVVINAKGT